MPRATVRVGGLAGEEQVKEIDRALQEVWGILSVVDINPSNGEVTFMYEAEAASLRDFHQALEQCGFTVNGGGDDGAGM